MVLRWSLVLLAVQAVSLQVEALRLVESPVA